MPTYRRLWTSTEFSALWDECEQGGVEALEQPVWVDDLEDWSENSDEH